MQITLRAARVNAGLTQKEAAKKIGISLASIKNYESGKSFPDVPTIKRIECTYGLEYRDIIFCPELHLKSNKIGGRDHG